MENDNFFKKDVYESLKSCFYIFGYSRLVCFKNIKNSYSYKIFYMSSQGCWRMSLSAGLLEFNTEKFTTQKSKFYLNFEDLYNEDKKK